MGCYINPGGWIGEPDNEFPKSMSKESWLAEYGHEFYPRVWEDVPEGQLPVCLINNGVFTSAAIAYNPVELVSLKVGTRDRPVMWYLALIDDLKKVSPLQTYLDRAS